MCEAVLIAHFDGRGHGSFLRPNVLLCCEVTQHKIIPHGADSLGVQRRNQIILENAMALG